MAVALVQGREGFGGIGLCAARRQRRSLCVDEAAPVLSPHSVCHPGVCVLVGWAWGHPTCRVAHKPMLQRVEIWVSE